MSPVKVYLRPIAMRMASEWIDEQLAADASILPRFKRGFLDVVRVFNLLRKNGKVAKETTLLNIDHDVAKRFVETLLPLFVKNAPHRLTQKIFVDSVQLQPGNGEHAIAEVAQEIDMALRKKEGRPMTNADPIVAFEINEKTKRTRCRNNYDTTAGQYSLFDNSLDATAKAMKISKNSAAHLIKDGRDATTVIEDAKQQIPPGYEVFTTLVDYKDKSVQLIVTPRKTR